jgi:hypothetical protein
MVDEDLDGLRPETQGLPIDTAIPKVDAVESVIFAPAHIGVGVAIGGLGLVDREGGVDEAVSFEMAFCRAVFRDRAVEIEVSAKDDRHRHLVEGLEDLIELVSADISEPLARLQVGIDDGDPMGPRVDSKTEEALGFDAVPAPMDGEGPH